MTTFETIILTIIYLICYGYIVAMFIKEENSWFRIIFIIVSLFLAFTVPLIFGSMLYERLETD